MNNENLKPFSEYSKAELKAISQKAGRRSGEVRREQAQRIAEDKYKGKLSRAELSEAIAFFAWVPLEKLAIFDKAVSNMRYIMSLPEDTPGRQLIADTIIKDIVEDYKRHILHK